MICLNCGYGRFYDRVPRSPMLPTRRGLPLGVVLAGGVGAWIVGRPAMALLVMIVVVDLAAMVTTVPATLVTTAVSWVVGTALSAHDGLILLLVALTASGFASLVRFGRDHYESQLARIPFQRREGSVTSPVR